MHIRPVTPSDARALLDIYLPYIEKSVITFETTDPGVAAFEQRITSYTEKYPWLVAQEDDVVIGYAYASKHREREAYQWCVESSVYVLPEYHGKGVAAALYRQLFEVLQEQGFINVFAGITLPNPKSYAFHRKMGFEPVGIYRNIGYKLGQWHDVAWFAKTLGTHPAAPLPPKW